MSQPYLNKTRYNAGLFVVASYLSIVAGVFTGPVVARALGPTGEGAIAEVTVLETLLAALCTLGLDVAVAHAAAQRPKERPQLLGVCIRLLAITVPLAIITDVALALGPLSNLASDELTVAVVILGFSSLNALTICAQAMLIAESALGSLGLLRLFLVVGPGAAAVLLFLAGSLNVVSYLILSAVGTLALLIGTLTALRVRPARGGRSAPLMRFATKGFLGSLLTFTNVHLDQVFIGPILGRRQLGYYAIAVTVATLPVVLSQAIAFKSFAPMTSAADGNRANEFAAPVRRSLMVGLPAAIAVGAGSPFLLSIIYGRAFEPALYPLLALLPGAVALGATTVTSTTLLAAGHPGTATIAQLSALVVTAFGLPLAIVTNSIVVAGGISTVSYLTMFAVGGVALKRLGGGHLIPDLEDWYGGILTLRKLVKPHRRR